MSGGEEAKTIYFESPGEFREWLEAHHETERELWVGYYKKGTGKRSMTWKESVDEALCFGWIDGIRRRVDDERYKNRFTPRKRSSNWSAVNIKRIGELIAQGLVRTAGLRAFEKRKAERSGVYSYEPRRSMALDEEYEQLFRANEGAWTYFQAQAPWYQRAAAHWVMSAKKEETRLNVWRR